MKKPFLTVLILAALTVASGWAQTPRQHTRPPYSGPRVKKPKKIPSFLANLHPGPRTGQAKKGKASHILVR